MNISSDKRDINGKWNIDFFYWAVMVLIEKGSAVEETSCLLPATLSPSPSFLPLGGKIRIVTLAGVADSFFSKAVFS